MAKKPAVHTVKTDEGWANITEGKSRHFGSGKIKTEAEAVGRASAQRRGVEHISHRADGTIGERRSYGNDPHPPRG